ncbi:hypothetical protein K461DRAFT_228288 [Myriangium duriaei CBS 260.36]|uniref:Pentatricopeptide repeat domain-containing protein n=1 Tax=Myriangium duriaei CBS 260.36 TaxID=1168546 RepID=A0A9P4MEH0_9PEZI|nr:hypothetical protein K461DRAFT_228288 [Myriangium duriaei CBS 260.36]
MPTQLTRAVFRQLASGQVLHHAGCRAPLRNSRRSPRNATSNLVALSSSEQRRSFFVSMFSSPRQGATKPRLDPGMEKLMEHSKRTRLRARLNDPAEVQRALKAFFKHKALTKALITDQQIGPVQQGYEYVRAIETAKLGINSLRQALHALEIDQAQEEGVIKSNDGLRPKARLALMIYLDLLQTSHASSHGASADDLYACVSILCKCGSAAKARELVASDTLNPLAFFPSLITVQPSQEGTEATTPLKLPQSGKKAAWTRILKGFAELKDEREMVQTFETAKMLGINMSESAQCLIIMCKFYAQHDSMDKAKEWYSHIGVKKSPSWYTDLRHRDSGFLECYEALIWACIRQKDLVWGKQLVADIFEVEPEKSFLDLVLVWSLGSGKGVEEVERMMDVMQQSSAYSADAETVNGLINLALWRKDAYTAERVVHMGERRGIKPDAQTFILQTDYRLAAGDTDGALGAYGRMQRETMAEEGQASATVNRLIRAMCEGRRHDFESIMDVAADMTDQHMTFEAKTVSTLAVLHLTRAEVEDAEDLLNTYSYQCSIAERQDTLNTIIQLCKDKEINTELAWSTYEMLRKAFDDMDREQRVRLMVEFFMRDRGDLALQVFEHMRLHTREDTLPTIDTYVSCLLGLEALADDENFAKLYNLLKLDTSIEPDTRLHNALMSTCIACGLTKRALSFWDAITTSDEGPDLRSVKLAFKACENVPGGDVKALGIHLRLEQSGFEVQPGYMAWLLGALGGNGKVDEAMELVTRYNSERGLSPTVAMIGSLINATKAVDEQQRILSWTGKNYPTLGSQLEKREVEADVWGRRQFSISEKGKTA